MKYLGIDFGLKRIGLATSEGNLASPYKIIDVKSIEDGIVKVSQIVKDEEFEQVIVGLPEGKIGSSTKKFIKGLKSRGFLVESIDEHLSSKAADAIMIETGINRKKRKLNDAHSAAIILQEYLDNLR